MRSALPLLLTLTALAGAYGQILTSNSPGDIIIAYSSSSTDTGSGYNLSLADACYYSDESSTAGVTFTATKSIATTNINVTGSGASILASPAPHLVVGANLNAAENTTITIACTDGVQSIHYTFAVYVKENTAPNITAVATSTAYSEGASAVRIFNTTSITDSTDTYLTSATVAISSSTCNAEEDVLAMLSTATTAISASYNSTTCTLALRPTASSGVATLAQFLVALGAVTYKDTSDKPVTTARVIELTVTDHAAENKGYASAALSGSTTVTLPANVAVDDAPVIYIGARAGESSANSDSFMSTTATPITIAEDAAAGSFLQWNSSDLIIYVRDVDGSDSDSTALTLTVNNMTDVPSADLFSAVATSDPAGSDSMAEMGFKIELQASTKTLDYENLLNKWPSFNTLTHIIPMNITAQSGNTTVSKLFQFAVTNADDALEGPEFYTSTAPSIAKASATGVDSSVRGFGQQRAFLRAGLNTSFIAGLGFTATDMLHVNSTSGSLIPMVLTHYRVLGDSSKPSMTYYPRQMIWGMKNSLYFPYDMIVDDATDEGQNMTWTLTMVGTIADATTPPSGETGIVEATEAVTSNGTDVSGMFSDTDMLSFKTNSTGFVISGTPVYDASTYNLSKAMGSHVSPTRKIMYFTLAAEDTDSNSESISFAISIEMPGCLDVRAAWVDSVNDTMNSSDVGSFPTYSDRAFYAAGDSTWGKHNPMGNFNPYATWPLGSCVFPPMAANAATANVTIRRDGQTSLTDALAAIESATDKVAAANAARGATTLDLPAGSTTAAVAISIDQLPTNDVATLAAPDAEAAIDEELVLKFGPCGQEFEKEVTVCMMVGAQPEGKYFEMYHAADVSCSDSALGYQPLQATSGNSYDPVTGKLCGMISHFSIVAGVTRTIPTASFQPSHYSAMGGGCPSDCSGNGYCRAYGKCLCFEGFEGFDCSKRQCPFSPSWAEDAAAVRVSSECSGRGKCQRDTGVCACFSGFEGTACERTTCPNDCSGHGRCRFVNELEHVAEMYSEWDINRIQSCECDAGYFGSDCSLRYCPYGDDPMTSCSSTDQQKQELTVSLPMSVDGANGHSTESGWTLASDDIVMIWTDDHNNEWTTNRIEGMFSGAPAATQTNIAAALKGLPNFLVDDGITVTAETVTASSATSRTITFTMSGDLNSGDLKTVGCPTQLGCPFPGCRPKFNQFRLERTALAAGATAGHIVILTPNFVEKAMSSDFGVRVAVTVGSMTYDSVTTKTFTAQVCRIVSDSTEPYATTGCTTVITNRPVPAVDATTDPINIGNGLRMKFGNASPSMGTYTFDYVPGSCGGAVTQISGDGRERIECAGRGVCDRSSGMCKCFPGYSGHNCAARMIVV